MISLVPVAAVLASERGVRPAPVIDSSDASQRDYWAYRLSVSPTELNAAIEKVGSSVAAVRRHLGARKLSFASMDDAVELSGMEYGGITPVGLPADWPLLVDESVAAHERLIIGSGIRGSKLLVTGALLAALPNAERLAVAIA